MVHVALRSYPAGRSHLKAHRLVLVGDVQQQVAQHPLPSELLHGLQTPRGVRLHRVIEVTGPVHGRDHNGREIRVARGPSLSRAMHSGRMRGHLRLSMSRYLFSLTVFNSLKCFLLMFYPIGVRISTWKNIFVLISSSFQWAEVLGFSILPPVEIKYPFSEQIIPRKVATWAVRRCYPLATPTAARNPVAAWNGRISHGSRHKHVG